MDNWGEIRQLINILFCGYRRLEIADPRMLPKPVRRERGRGHGNTSSDPIRGVGFAGGKTF